MQLVPLAHTARQVIERYGASGFRVSGTVHLGPVFVFPDRTEAWQEAAITAASLGPVMAHGEIELLLLGTGRRMSPVPAAVRAALKAAGIAIEPMDTGAACRTYNVLLAEERRVAAALLLPI